MKEKGSTTIPNGSTLENQGEKVATFTFYVLIDPRDNKIKYIGRTVDLKNRYRNHIYEAKKNNRNKRERWIVSLLRKNMTPVIKPIYYLNCTLTDAIITEKTLVKKLIKRGFELKNEPDNYLGAVLTGKPVYQYTLEGEFIKSYANSNQAKIITGIHDASILENCKGKVKSAGNYMWSFTKLDKLPPYNKDWRKEKGKPVIAIFSDGTKKEYVNARKASVELNIPYKRISAICNGRQKSTRGITFKFKS